MRIYTPLALLGLLSLIVALAFNHKKEDTLTRAWEKIQSTNYLTYTAISYWPNPAGIVDTTQQTTAFLRQDRPYFPYDYVARQAAYDIVYTDARFMMVNHGDSVVSAFSEADMKKNQRRISDNTVINHSPLSLLDPARNDWQYVQDTTVDDHPRQQFYRVEMDTLIDGNKIYAEQHIFLDPATALLTGFERRAYNQDKLSQKIRIYYQDYTLRNSDRTYLAYAPPAGYVTQIYGEREKLMLVEEGQKAPAFSQPASPGQPIIPEDLTGKYVLLDFSVINCGYCKKALDHFNREGFQLSEKITGLYVNPTDDPKQLQQYRDKITIPFSVVTGADAIRKAYGVTGYPTFVLINPEGIIEKVVVGYQEEFIESLEAL